MTIKFKHLREELFNFDIWEGHTHNLGGATLAFTEAYGGNFYVGIAICANNDNFCKKIGRHIATARLVSRGILVEREEFIEFLQLCGTGYFHASPVLKKICEHFNVRYQSAL